MSFEIPLPPEWMKKALCAEIGGDMWFPEDGEHGGPTKGICGTCEVRAECLEYAITNDEKYGIWGGMSRWQRDQLSTGKVA